MESIWYLLKCPKGGEAGYVRKYRELAGGDTLQEVICFEYQRLMRYGGTWHLEKRMLLPGCIFLSGVRVLPWMEGDLSLIPCNPLYLKELCQEENLIGMSKGIIKNERAVVTSGPLKGREQLIRHIDRHKRTARIEVPLGNEKTQVTVGLEICEKQVCVTGT